MPTSVNGQSGEGGLRAHLIKGASGSLAIQVGFAGLAFLNALVLARWLGAGGYGAYAGAMAWVSLLLIPAVLGLDNLLVRDTAIFRSRQEWGKLKGLLRFSTGLVLATSIMAAGALAAIAHWGFADAAKASLRHTMYVAAFLPPVLALATLAGSGLRGIERVILANLPGMIVRPALLLLAILLVVWLWPNRLSAPAAMALNLGAAVVALVVGLVWVRKYLGPQIADAQPRYTARPWLAAALPMLVYSGSQTVLGQTDMAMLGAMRGTAETGIYAAANRLAYLLVFGMAATGVILAPVMARLHDAGDKARLQRIVTKAARVSFLLVLPFGLALIFFGPWFLGFFGEAFKGGELVLAILAVGRLADVALGASALLLTMTGHERLVAVTYVVAAAANVLLNALLIPSYGAVGAAIASIVCVISIKFLMWLFAYARVGQDMSVLGLQPISWLTKRGGTA